MGVVSGIIFQFHVVMTVINRRIWPYVFFLKLTNCHIKCLQFKVWVKKIFCKSQAIDIGI